MHSILLVEDDITLGETLQEQFRQAGYLLTWCSTGAAALEFLRSNTPDLAIVDVGLPDRSGFDVGYEVKLAHGIPLMFLTAMNTAEHRLHGFELGAEDYIPKPFHLKELLLRVQRVLERKKIPATMTLPGNRTLDMTSGIVTTADGSHEQLSTSELRLWQLLAQDAPRAVARERISVEVFGKTGASTRSIDNLVVRLRKVLGSELVESIRGVGYRAALPAQSCRSSQK